MTKKYYFTVTGRGAFPLDMLRYDGCYPVHPEDVDQIQQSLDPRWRRDRKEAFKIRMATYKQIPTKERWSSFIWHVTDIEEIRA
jgi:hypothetical protein